MYTFFILWGLTVRDQMTGVLKVDQGEESHTLILQQQYTK